MGGHCDCFISIRHGLSTEDVPELKMDISCYTDGRDIGPIENEVGNGGGEKQSREDEAGEDGGKNSSLDIVYQIGLFSPFADVVDGREDKTCHLTS